MGMGSGILAVCGGEGDLEPEGAQRWGRKAGEGVGGGGARGKLG